MAAIFILSCRFNTQPPEGGWRIVFVRLYRIAGFNTQPPEGGWFAHDDVTAFHFSFQHTAA